MARPWSIGVPAASRNGPKVAWRGTSVRPQIAATRGASDAPEMRTIPTAPRPLAVETATIGSSWRASGSIGPSGDAAAALLAEHAQPLVDQVLLRDREDVVGQPVQDQAGREEEEHHREDERH